MSYYKICVSNVKKKSRDKVIKRIADEAGISKGKLTVEKSSRKSGKYEIIVEGKDAYERIVEKQLRLGNWTITRQGSSPARLKQTSKSSESQYTPVKKYLIVTLAFSDSPDIKAQNVVEKLRPPDGHPAVINYDVLVEIKEGATFSSLKDRLVVYVDIKQVNCSPGHGDVQAICKAIHDLLQHHW